MNVTIIGADNFDSQTNLTLAGGIDLTVEGEDRMSVSDGHHTFDELYDHRITLYIALCRTLERVRHGETNPCEVWRSYKHSDGSGYQGWFVLGINKGEGKQITYHLPVDRWDECNFATELERAPEFDGHSSEDVLDRIKLL